MSAAPSIAEKNQGGRTDTGGTDTADGATDDEDVDVGRDTAHQGSEFEDEDGAEEGPLGDVDPEELALHLALSARQRLERCRVRDSPRRE